MTNEEMKILNNHFMLEAIYLRELKEGTLTIDDYIKRIALFSENTIDMLQLK